LNNTCGNLKNVFESDLKKIPSHQLCREIVRLIFLEIVRKHWRLPVLSRLNVNAVSRSYLNTLMTQDQKGEKMGLKTRYGRLILGVRAKE